MSKNSKLSPRKNENKAVAKAPVGRKRDESLDSNILEATLKALAEVGYDRMTMDLVAQHAKTGKASMYRRWNSKIELVRDALLFMNNASVNVAEIPDTGSIRGDLLALVKPKTAAQSERKIKVLSGLGSFFSEYRKISEDISTQIFGAWEKANAQLFERAIKRGEISKSANIAQACSVISAVTAYTTTMQFRMFDKRSYEELLDGIILPALRAGTK